MFAKLLCLTICVVGAFGASCQSPKATPSYYSTTDGFFHFSTTFIVEFTLTCSNDIHDMPVYAVVNGKVLQAAVSEETTKYQISWQEEHKNAGSQTFNVEVFDEDGFAAYRKAQRNNEDVSKVKPLFLVDLRHPGISKGPWVGSEAVMTLTAGGLFYFAYTLRSHLQA